jgi:hypothetical protein
VAYVALGSVPDLFERITLDDLYPSEWLPFWAFAVSYVHLDPQSMHNPPTMLVVARAIDMVVLMIVPPISARALGWIAAFIISPPPHRRYQVAGGMVVLVGALIGLAAAWVESPLYRLSISSMSGEWANTPRVFLMWLPHIDRYWPWPTFGALICGLSFYALMLIRK